MSESKRTPIYPEYAKSGAKTIDFGGWDLPVQFSSIKHEHEVTRTKAGLFDVSHMGEIVVKGPKSKAFLQFVLTNDVAKLEPGKAQYTIMCYEDGGTVDDLIVYMLDDEEYLLVVNAANTENDASWLAKQSAYSNEKLQIENVSDQYVQLAIQGPNAESILQKCTEESLEEIKFFRFKNQVKINGIEAKALISRTGYTGEDGFEIYIDAHAGSELWNLLLSTGESEGLEPIGLGARDTLRFEANLALYGQELSEFITPIEAGLGFAVKVNKDTTFIGKEVLKNQIDNGTSRKLIGIEMIDKGIPRHNYPVFREGKEIGFITSGTQSPTLKKNVGLALIDTGSTAVGTEVEVKLRKRMCNAKVVSTPFYKREK